jgi:ADP-ribose pyrophosphatase YjhB (NUDIX family)
MKSISYLSHLSVDNVIFGYHNKQLKVLLMKLKDHGFWMLPGGFVKQNESILTAAKRVANERTGLDQLYLNQFKTYGDPLRNKDSRIDKEKVYNSYVFNQKEVNIIDSYFVSIGYYTLTEFSKVEVQLGPVDEDCQWFALDKIPDLLYDHNQLIKDALTALRFHVDHYPIGKKLLEKKFTMPEIQALYETILEKSIDRRNFSKKIMKSGILIKLDEQRNIGAHRAPYLYTFHEEKYAEALQNGIASFF